MFKIRYNFELFGYCLSTQFNLTLRHGAKYRKWTNLEWKWLMFADNKLSKLIFFISACICCTSPVFFEVAFL